MLAGTDEKHTANIASAPARSAFDPDFIRFIGIKKKVASPLFCLL
jgi:hypothetical protein